MSESIGKSHSRRKFLGRAGAVVASGALSLQGMQNLTAQAKESDSGKRGRPNDDDDRRGDRDCGPDSNPSPNSYVERANRAYEIRVEAARRERSIPIPPHPDNGDEYRYSNYIGNYSKGLKHNDRGEVLPEAYNAYKAAIRSGSFQRYEALRPYLGCPEPERQLPFVNPEAANAYDLEGTDSVQLFMPPAPAFASAEEAGEMVELYWMSLLRDVSFDDYDQNPIALEAADDLSRLSVFRGPKVNGRVTPQTLFRDVFPGCTTGPYISQFLLRQVYLGAQAIDQRIAPYAPGTNYMTRFEEWLDVQNGCVPADLNIPNDSQVPLRFVQNGRDISKYVRLDVLYQAYFVAMLYLIDGVTLNEATSPFVFHYPFDAGNPYGPTGSTFVQSGFGTFGTPHIATLVAEPATRALKAVWFQKWDVHRRLRPEEFGGYVDVMKRNLGNYPINPELFSSSVLGRIYSEYQSYLLPQAFPEGSPLHPSYGSGHATVAGACVTMLKAFFDESQEILEPVQTNPADGGQTVIPYEGPTLTVGGELNKLASNIAQARDHAGVHWRSDAVQGILLGEAVAISILRDMQNTYSEPFKGFSLTKFDGTTITV